MHITGSVVYVPLSGGFYGIKGDTGRKYCPVNGLPGPFCKPGMRVEARLRPAAGVGIQMWGEQVYLQDISTQ